MPALTIDLPQSATARIVTVAFTPAKTQPAGARAVLCGDLGCYEALTLPFTFSGRVIVYGRGYLDVTLADLSGNLALTPGTPTAGPISVDLTQDAIIASPGRRPIVNASPIAPWSFGLTVDPGRV